MTDNEMIELVRKNLGREVEDIVVSDVIVASKVYCNIKEVPKEMEPFIRKKVKMVLEYEAASDGSIFDVASIKEGDTSISYSSNITRDTVYGLSDADKKVLREWRVMKR